MSDLLKLDLRWISNREAVEYCIEVHSIISKYPQVLQGAGLTYWAFERAVEAFQNEGYKVAAVKVIQSVKKKNMVRASCFLAFRRNVEFAVINADSVEQQSALMLIGKIKKCGWRMQDYSIKKFSSSLAALLEDINEPISRTAVLMVGADAALQRLEAANEDFQATEAQKERAVEKNQEDLIVEHYAKLEKEYGLLTSKLQLVLPIHDREQNEMFIEEFNSLISTKIKHIVLRTTSKKIYNLVTTL